MIKKFIAAAIFFLIVTSVFSMTATAGDNIERTGDVFQYIIPAAAGCMTLYKGDRQGSVQLSKSFLTTLATTYALKYSINEKRPNGGSHSFPGKRNCNDTLFISVCKNIGTDNSYGSSCHNIFIIMRI